MKVDRAQTVVATFAISQMSGLSAQERADVAGVGFRRGAETEPHAALALPLAVAKVRITEAGQDALAERAPIRVGGRRLII